MRIVKPGKVREPRVYFGRCRYCGCEFLVSEEEIQKSDLYGKTCNCPNKTCHGRVDLSSDIPAEYKDKMP